MNQFNEVVAVVGMGIVFGVMMAYALLGGFY
jgi:hypothetical protein